MPVYNGGFYLKLSIESILSQTFSNIEFIIINDASTDGSDDIVGSFNDPRIRLVSNFHKLGLPQSLNRGIGLAKGRYIARQDADDISLPERIAIQLDFMKKNPHIALLGTWGYLIDGKGKIKKRLTPPSDPTMLKWQMIFRNQFIHSSIMGQTEVFKKLGGYNINAVSEDYDLWCRIMHHYEIAQLPEPLILYRKHQSSYSAENYKAQSESVDRNVCRNIRRILENTVSMENAHDLNELFNSRLVGDIRRLKKLGEILIDICNIVIKKWKLDKCQAKTIRSNCAGYLVIIAGMSAEFELKPAICMLVSALQIDKGIIFRKSVYRSIAKILLGPTILKKTKNRRKTS